MTRKGKSILLLISSLVLCCSALILVVSSQAVNDYFTLNNRRTETDLAVAFTLALRMNHPAAYEMIETDLTKRLDDWMKTHRVPSCKSQIIDDDILAGGVQGIGYTVFYPCKTAENKSYIIKVHNIKIEDMKVVDWGEIVEDIR